jgi:DNA-binding MarR family transcriptional regulator
LRCILKEHEKLFDAFNRFMQIKTECRLQIVHQYNIAKFTLKQIEYLKKFDGRQYVTLSQLAEELSLSKPSITEMVRKFIQLDCVKKEQCNHDARVYYLFLTDKGKKIARLEQLVNEHFIRRMGKSLNEEEINLLIEIFLKIV